MTITEGRQQLTALQHKLAAYDHALALMSYDGATSAPKGTAANRAQSMGVLSEELYRLSTGEETVALLEFLDAHKTELDEKEQRIVYLMLRDIRRMQKIPMDEYIAYEKLTVTADDVWHTCKQNNDFATFAPYLQQIFDANRKFARYTDPDKDPYDACLNRYEEGLDRQQCDAFFATLRAHIVPLLHAVMARPQLDNSLLHGRFPADRQEALARRIMPLMGLDTDHVGLATTEHPFTTSLGSHLDERITTHYYEEDFSDSLFSVIHEGGHALYDTGSADDLAYTMLDCGVSMGIHESQSRFYENILGRSQAFCDHLMPILQEIFPEEMAGHTADELYRAVNRVEPSLIRTQADELTYCLHIMVRYELEKQLMDGVLTVAELPQAWNALYREYLGIDVPDDRRGVLQDTHWSGGLVGYFPSYAIGNAYGAQFLRKMAETVDVADCLRRGDFGPINDWNRSHIWRFGSLKTPNALFADATGETFDPTVYTAYLEEKYGRLYGIC